MRDREKIVQSLERVYREAYQAAEARGDADAMARLDFEFQRDQVHLEVMLDLRALLTPPPAEGEEEASLVDRGTALLEKARTLKNITRLR